jgi:hypothetical protein
MPTRTSNQSVLSVQLSGSDYGSVSSAPAEIDCGQTYNAAFTTGALVTLTATAVANGNFIGWGGACQGTTPTCTVTMQPSTLVTAQFMRIGIPLSVTKSGDGTGSVSSQPAGISCGTQ